MPVTYDDDSTVREIVAWPDIDEKLQASFNMCCMVVLACAANYQL